MRPFLLAAALGLIASPGLCLDPVARPKATPQHLRELPDDWLDRDVGIADERAPERHADAGDVADDEDRGTAQRDAEAASDCKPASGTTGAIIGAVAGGLLGNVIDGGRHRAGGTIVGAGGGALLGREIEKRRGCR